MLNTQWPRPRGRFFLTVYICVQPIFMYRSILDILAPNHKFLRYFYAITGFQPLSINFNLTKIINHVSVDVGISGNVMVWKLVLSHCLWIRFSMAAPYFWLWATSKLSLDNSYLGQRLFFFFCRKITINCGDLLTLSKSRKN